MEQLFLMFLDHT